MSLNTGCMSTVAILMQYQYCQITVILLHHTTIIILSTLWFTVVIILCVPLDPKDITLIFNGCNSVVNGVGACTVILLHLYLQNTCTYGRK